MDPVKIPFITNALVNAQDKVSAHLNNRDTSLIKKVALVAANIFLQLLLLPLRIIGLIVNPFCERPRPALVNQDPVAIPMINIGERAREELKNAIRPILNDWHNRVIGSLTPNEHIFFTFFATGEERLDAYEKKFKLVYKNPQQLATFERRMENELKAEIDDLDLPPEFTIKSEFAIVKKEADDLYSTRYQSNITKRTTNELRGKNTDTNYRAFNYQGLQSLLGRSFDVSQEFLDQV